jgi:polyphosphate glucokinase
VQGFGVDIGGSGIKGCVVDLDKGELVGERVRIRTPQPALPDPVYRVVGDIVGQFGWTGRIGVTYPGVMKHGVAFTAANMDASWIGTDVASGLEAVVPGTVQTLNDADAAGLAEMAYGAGAGQRGLVLMLTFGTGIGSALLVDGRLVPNTELGHLELDGHDAEKRAAASVRDDEKMSYKEWAKRVNRYMSHVEQLFTPDLFVVGGGVSKDAEKWVPRLKLNTPVKPAELLNEAGIVGAAIAAVERKGE